MNYFYHQKIQAIAERMSGSNFKEISKIIAALRTLIDIRTFIFMKRFEQPFKPCSRDQDWYSFHGIGSEIYRDKTHESYYFME